MMIAGKQPGQFTTAYFKKLLDHPALERRQIRAGVLFGAFLVAFAVLRFLGGGFDAQQVRRQVMASPQALISMNEKQVTRVLGYPALHRVEPPAQHWQYQADSCVLDLFLYESEKKNRRAEVVHYQLRKREQSEIEEDLRGAVMHSCLADLLRRR